MSFYLYPSVSFNQVELRLSMYQINSSNEMAHLLSRTCVTLETLNPQPPWRLRDTCRPRAPTPLLTLKMSTNGVPLEFILRALPEQNRSRSTGMPIFAGCWGNPLIKAHMLGTTTQLPAWKDAVSYPSALIFSTRINLQDSKESTTFNDRIGVVGAIHRTTHTPQHS